MSRSRKRRALASFVLLPVAWATPSGPATADAIASISCRPAQPIGSFLDSLGVNTHMQQGGQYADAVKTVETLKDLGIVQVREAFTGVGQAQLDYAAQNGIKFDFVINAGWGDKAVPALETWAKTYPGSIIAVEGPNEVNNWPVTYAGSTGVPAAKQFQRDLYIGVHASPVLGRVPVLALTSWPVFKNASDIGNIHAYARSGGYVLPDIRKGVDDELSANPPKKPIWLTEVGYHTGVGLAGMDEGVSEAVHAVMIMSLMLSAHAEGITKSFVYQLADQFGDPSSGQSHFGLVDQHWRPKPAFNALRALISIFGRAGAGAPTDAASLAYGLEDLPDWARSTLFQASSGDWLLAIWTERDLWNATAHRLEPAPATTSTLRLGARHDWMASFDPLGGPEPIRMERGQNAFQYSLQDRPVLIWISNGTQGTVDKTCSGNR